MPEYPRPTAVIQQLLERAEDAILQSYALRDAPLRIRPLMVFFTAAWLILLGVLGFAPLPQLPINDKALHFFGLGMATFLIYFILEVPEGPHKRVWYIRRAPLILALFLGFFVGGVISELTQSLLPWKTFQWGDILANLLGSTLFLYIGVLLRRRARQRSEIAELYQPLSVVQGQVYRDAQGRRHAFAPAAGAGAAAGAAAAAAGAAVAGGAIALPDDDGQLAPSGGVWDDDIDDDLGAENPFALASDDEDRDVRDMV